MDDSSDDSDICEISRNVQSVLVESRISREELDDYAYKRRLGDLIFDANFEAGNLGYVENVDRYEYDLMVRPDVSNTKHRIWFNFRISNQRQDQCVILTFVNLSENLRLFHDGYCPVIRSRRQPNWKNLDEEQVFYYQSKNHGNRYVLSLVLKFLTQEDEHQLALFYPYSYSNLCDFLGRWEVESKRFAVKRTAAERKVPKGKRFISSPEPLRRPSYLRLAHREDEQLRTRSSLNTRSDEVNASDSNVGYEFEVNQVGQSVLLRSIYCISIGGARIAEPPENRAKPIVVLLCRTCGGNLDTVASFVSQGLTDYLLSDTLIAGAARECIDFRIYPMLDPDSVCSGNSCTDLLGRQAGEQSAALIEADPEFCSNLIGARQSLKSILDLGRRTILLELQVNPDSMGSLILGSHFSDTLRMEKHLSLPKSMSKFIEGFYLEACRFSNKNKTSRCTWLTEMLVGYCHVDHYQLELSPFGSFKRSLKERDYLRYDQIAYLTIGKAIVYSLVDVVRPKRAADNVSAFLERFQHHPSDVDDFTLNVSKLH